MRAALAKTINLYVFLSVLVGAQAAVLVFVRGFGNSQADVIAGSVLGFIALVAFVGHTYLASVSIPVPAGVYDVLSWVNGIAVTLVAAGGAILQYVSPYPSLTPWVTLALGGGALFVSLFAGWFQNASAAELARRARVVARK
jgi:hypothetical protein